LTATLGAFSKTHDKLVYGGAVTVAGVALYYFLVQLPASQENYMAIFVGDQSSACKDASTIDKCAQVAFLPGEAAILRINNFHDYYNISMILNGKTGLEFVAEEAEKGGSSK